MFAFRDSLEATSTTSRVEVAFTDSSLDLHGLGPDFGEALAQLEAEAGLPFARLHQVHGDQVHVVTVIPPRGPIGAGAWPSADAQVTNVAGVGLMVRVADCLPVVLADADAGVIGAAHAGRAGTSLDIATRTVEAMRKLGAATIRAWIGPHVCGACYEVPQELQDEVSARVPEARSTTSWGTAALDLAAGVRAQLKRAGVAVQTIQACTREDPTFHSYRRDGAAAGRFAGLVWMS